MVTSLVFTASAPTEKFYKLTIKANDFFERHQYNEAILEYTRIIQMSKEVIHENKDYLALIYSNRSASYFKLNQYEKAKQDALQAISLASNWPKVTSVHDLGCITYKYVFVRGISERAKCC